MDVEPQVAGEMVACSRRHDDQRQVGLQSQRGHGRHRAVTAGDPQHLGAALDGTACKGRGVLARIHEQHMGAETLGRLDQPEALDLAAAGPGVHHQDRGRRARRRVS